MAFMILLVVAYQTEPNPFQMNKMENLAAPVSSMSKKDQSLYNEIKRKSEEYKEEPQNAVIDKVWKKTPGLNGLKVDVKKSFNRMKEKGEFDESLLVFKQIKPEVTLEDLPPAPIYRGNPDKQMVSFLINVSWGGEYIPSILQTLKKNNVKATFFVEGQWAKKNPDLLKMIKEEGHVIGNHAYNHPDMKRLSQAESTQQIQKTNDIIKAIIGTKPKWFAPPSGSFNNGVVEGASTLQMETLLWTVDTIDWRKPTKSVMVNRVMANIQPGAMILMHPTPVIEKGLNDLISKIKQKNLKIGTVDKLLTEKRY
ncbi:polysaccharide deacetylase family protein [Aquibacillus sp. 3ASR75-11]|uniref:Polysaccharide deacetylase family protein n=2 Tax=Terrihalobacillus insolitus TaxID=2950438 RepID=A0A9X4AL90_9BACI|nr:polysaccharide deacetylase family protein [Terrihalobacillus insolitus]MDC3414093.1 polysaccharide deacetylase family protein [Terrihalobacillus insolitus]MDC3423534.1 polysaccharide deacetylase family protein [Terrihalobacillus insolitus]